jgi:hypothetical protein
MPNSITTEPRTASLGAFPHEVMADEVIEISDDMLLELVADDQATRLATPPPLPQSV